MDLDVNAKQVLIWSVGDKAVLVQSAIKKFWNVNFWDSDPIWLYLSET